MPRLRCDAVDQAIGEGIRRARQRRGLTLKQLADRLGITHQQVQKYETAADRISANRLLRIAIALDQPVESFFGHAYARRR
jgi:transcriptional regulator with XRE-family HTH domain